VEVTEEVSEEVVEVVVVLEEIEEVSEEEEGLISVMKIKQERKELFQVSKELENNFDFSFQNHFILIFISILLFHFILYIYNFIL
jgi:hypothetical protein